MIKALHCVVLNEHRTLSELVELLRVELQNLIARISVRKEYFSGPQDSCLDFSNQIDFCLPARAQLRDHLILTGKSFPGREVKGLDFCRPGPGLPFLPSDFLRAFLFFLAGLRRFAFRRLGLRRFNFFFFLRFGFFFFFARARPRPLRTRTFLRFFLRTFFLRRFFFLSFAIAVYVDNLEVSPELRSSQLRVGFPKRGTWEFFSLSPERRAPPPNR